MQKRNLWGMAGAVLLAAALLAGTHTVWPHLHSTAKPSPPLTTTPKVIALTFDDGPSPQYTPEILSLLTRYHAHATFFVLGSEVAHWPGIVKDIVKQGSAVANHGYVHVNYFRVGVSGVIQDMDRTAALLKKEKIPTVPFYRPPYGNSNKALVAALHQKGLTVALWSIDTRDWTSPGTSFITKRVLANARPGAIVLMHDSGGNRSQTVSALAAILPVLKSEGYQLVTLPQYVKDLHLSSPPQLPLPNQPQAVPKKMAAGPWI